MRVILPKIAFILSSVVIVYLLGFAAGNFHWFPYDLLVRVQRDLRTVGQDLKTRLGLKPSHFVHPARHEGDGVTHRDPRSSASGLTLITSYGGTAVRLIDEDGAIVRQWQVRFSDFYPDPSVFGDTERPRTDWNTDLHGALIEPDGAIVFNFEYLGTVKLDRCGDTLWALPAHGHHSISRASDGSYWVPGLANFNEESPWPLVQPPAVDNTLMKISSDGDVVLEESLTEILLKSQLYPLLTANGENEVALSGELVHLNDIEELPSEMESAFPLFIAGDLLLSIRDHNLVLVVDPDTLLVKWWQVGPWVRQHDPDFQPDGTITVFNNNSDGTEDGGYWGGSNIIKIDPASRKWEVIYGDTPPQRFFADIRGKHQLLPNGNLLVTEFVTGRAVEGTPEGSIAWVYINRYDADEVLEVTEAARYPREYFDVANWSCAGGQGGRSGS